MTRVSNLKQPSRLNGSLSADNEGLSVLTSGQRSELQSFLNKDKPSFDVRSFDGNFIDAGKYVFRNDKHIIEAIDSSIHDEHCTKQFFDATNTWEQFFHYESPSVENRLWSTSVRAACAVLEKQMNICTLQPHVIKSEDDLWAIWSNPKASAGAIKIGSSKRDSILECYKGAKAIKTEVRKGKQPLIPAIPYHRSQISGFLTPDGEYDPEGLKKKDRLVWGLDGATVSVEGQYAQPLISYLSEHWRNYAGGKSPEWMRKHIESDRREKFFWLSLDFSKFDQTVPDWLIHQCFNIIRKFYDEKYYDELNWIEYEFINTTIAIPGHGILQKHKGIPSGSNFTQVVGSMANFIMVTSYIASTCKERSFSERVRYVEDVLSSGSGLTIYAMGDDNLMFLDLKLTLEDLATYVHRVFGVNVHPEKCDQGTKYEPPHFLKREWRGDCEYMNPAYIIINVGHPERRRTYEGYSAWHIMYGLYLTYTGSFKDFITERELLLLMEASGGVKALKCIPRSDLPGVFRAFGDKALEWMADRAESLLESYRAT